MDKFYLLTDDDRLDGPYTPAELRSRGITPETKLWVEDRAAWIEAGELDGFASFFLGGNIIDEESEPEASEATVKEEVDAPNPLVAHRSPRRLMMVYCWVVSAYILAYTGGVLLMWLTVK